MDFRLRIRVDIGERTVADRASHVENPVRTEIRLLAPQVADDARTHIVVKRAHAAHRVDIDPAVVDRARRQVVLLEFGVIGAGLTMDIDRGMIQRQR